MRTIYNILFTTFFVLTSPYYFMRMRRRGDWLEGFFQRFGAFGDGPSLYLRDPDGNMIELKPRP